MPSIVERALSPSDKETPSSTRKASVQPLSRNIDQVVLGNVVFDTWYYSPYPDGAVLLTDSDVPALRLNGGGGGGGGGGGSMVVNGSRSSERSTSTPLGGNICARLHVCPYCFAYAQSASAYVSHLRHHQRRQQEDAEAKPVPDSATQVYEHDGYSVWEIDGEYEKLYCQNLSLFGKLFLEQKSVFFDTGGFLYYVLTYTPPDEPISPSKRGRKRTDSAPLDNFGLKTQVLGFFSKENPSWDSNNLACILIFPPYQHRQLGKLLMAVSYKLSGWEWEGGVIGGPEKPLSTMGRRSYLRFWSERIARFMMGETADADGRTVFGRSRKKIATLRREEMSIKDIGERTGMLPEDVVAALTEMGVCQLKKARKKHKKTGDANGSGVQSGVDDDEPVADMTVLRSRVLDWARLHGVNLEDPVKEEGFLGEWAMSDDNDDGGDDDMDVGGEEEEGGDST